MSKKEYERLAAGAVKIGYQKHKIGTFSTYVTGPEAGRRIAAWILAQAERRPTR